MRVACSQRVSLWLESGSVCRYVAGVAARVVPACVADDCVSRVCCQLARMSTSGHCCINSKLSSLFEIFSTAETDFGEVRHVHLGSEMFH